MTIKTTEIQKGDLIVGLKDAGPVVDVTIDGTDVTVSFEDGDNSWITASHFVTTIFRGVLAAP